MNIKALRRVLKGMKFPNARCLKQPHYTRETPTTTIQPGNSDGYIFTWTYFDSA